MSTQTIAEQFQTAFSAGDEHAIRALLADDATFSGPAAHTEGADATAAGLADMAKMMSASTAEVTLSDDTDALIWSSTTTEAGTRPTATRLRVAGGKITAIETVFNMG